MLEKDKPLSRPAQAMIETANDMRRAGILDEAARAKITMRHLGDRDRTEVEPLTGEDIRAMRERAHMSISTRGASAGIPSGGRFHHPGGMQAISRG